VATRAAASLALLYCLQVSIDGWHLPCMLLLTTDVNRPQQLLHHALVVPGAAMQVVLCGKLGDSSSRGVSNNCVLGIALHCRLLVVEQPGMQRKCTIGCAQAASTPLVRNLHMMCNSSAVLCCAFRYLSAAAAAGRACQEVP
jgi:hypothetical protein